MFASINRLPQFNQCACIDFDWAESGSLNDSFLGQEKDVWTYGGGK